MTSLLLLLVSLGGFGGQAEASEAHAGTTTTTLFSVCSKAIAAQNGLAKQIDELYSKMEQADGDGNIALAGYYWQQIMSLEAEERSNAGLVNKCKNMLTGHLPP